MVTRKIARGAWMNPAETGFFYLNSRYYDTETGRFISADAYVSTGQSVLGFNMYAYCNNSPINFKDDTGTIAMTCFGDGDLLSKLRPDVSGGYAGGESAMQMATNLAVGLAVTNLAVAVAKSVDEEKEEAKDIALTTTIPDDTVIYRYGGTNPGNFVPSERDVMLNSGLSFSTITRPGAAMTTIGALNATGLVFAIRDGVTHVSVYPIGGTIAEWRRQGSSSIWTLAIKAVVVKWGG